jgi:hypothetical protein
MNGMILLTVQVEQKPDKAIRQAAAGSSECEREAMEEPRAAIAALKAGFQNRMDR